MKQRAYRRAEQGDEGISENPPLPPRSPDSDNVTVDPQYIGDIQQATIDRDKVYPQRPDHKRMRAAGMNKLLTTVILLCLPDAALAEIWFCQTTHWAVLDQEAKFAQEHEGGFIIDTDKGFRNRASNTGLYGGSCIETTDVTGQPKIFCEEDKNLLDRLTSGVQLFIDIKTQTFTYVRTNLWGGFGVGIETNLGICTKA